MLLSVFMQGMKGRAFTKYQDKDNELSFRLPKNNFWTPFSMK